MLVDLVLAFLLLVNLALSKCLLQTKEELYVFLHTKNNFLPNKNPNPSAVFQAKILFAKFHSSSFCTVRSSSVLWLQKC